MASRSWIALLSILLLAGCGGSPPTRAASRSLDAEWFSERASESGLNFVHSNGMSGEFYYPEIMPPGVGLLDFDNDGDLDVYVVQGRTLGAGKSTSATPVAPSHARGGRLYRNDLAVRADGSRALRFTDVTEAAGIFAHGYGMGIAVGDVDNDGCVDMFLTNFGQNQLFRNNCDGTFTDASKESRLDGSGWAVSASFLDFDRDGWLDLFVGNYVTYAIETDVRCFMLSGGPNYCPPQVYRPQPSRLYHNNRDGTFTEVTGAAGMATEFGPALGVSTADFDADGWPDIYVANDGQPNQLWINQHDGTFKNLGIRSGTALSDDGRAKSSMGVDAADFDNDGDEDLVVTELTGQGADLYVNDGTGTFEERSAAQGIRFASLPYTGFGVGWLDADNDGWLDLLTVNGAVTRDPQKPKEPFSLQQRKQLLRNLGNGRFEDVTNRAGPAFQLAEVGRGAAFGDVDNDGDIDVVVANDNGPLRLLVNNVGNRNHWVGLRIVGSKTSRDLLGARVSVVTADGVTRWRRVRSDGSYGSANDPRVLVGLGQSSRISSVKVIWPNGGIEERRDVPIDRYTTIEQGLSR